jgi:hypothetical protein
MSAATALLHERRQNIHEQRHENGYDLFHLGLPEDFTLTNSNGNKDA